MALVTDRRMRLFHASARGATPAGRCCKDGTGNFNPRPPRGGRLGYSPTLIVIVSISIHAPREGGDGRGRQAVRLRNDFNPRPPRGGRLLISRTVIQTIAFQSTPPARGATKPPRPGPHLLPFQSTPPARGATARVKCKLPPDRISIHAPREGGDQEQRSSG